ncbi:MAG: APC family permease [Chloroflexi bacterium]|nr:APC family permease [Chloroflexota bacterium]
MYRLRTLLLGSPLPTAGLSHEKLGKFKGLATFSPDALSSIAYANQEIFLGLAVAGSAGLGYTFTLGLIITAILIVVAISYLQTIHEYPSGAGSYIVAKANLGDFPGLVAAAALMMDYLLVAAVSLTAGVEALASAFPVIWPYRIAIALLLLAFITILNMRGLQETGAVMSIPVYFFIGSFLIMIIFGLFRLFTSAPIPFPTTMPGPVQPLSIFILLRAFASGSTALTGVEAISNGVPAFKKPESKNAGITLIVMSILMGFLFLSTLGLSKYFGIVAVADETILSALSRQLFDNSILYYVIQISTLAMLAVAANTAFADFPRIAAILAGDRYLPSQLKALGDRLVFANGNLLLAAATAVLIIIFRGDSHSLIPLFAIGAFLAFTLSQAGMVRHWIRKKTKGWRTKAFINGLGTFTTGTVVVIVGVGKFIQGAWITLIIIPLTIWLFLVIHRHYEKIAQQLSLKGLPPELKPYPKLRFVMPISGVHRGIFHAVDFARSISKNLIAIYVEVEPGTGEKVRKKWEEWFPDIALKIVPSPYRSIIGPFIDFLDRYDVEANDGQLAGVILPEFVTEGFWSNILHNQLAWLIKFALLYRRRKKGYQQVIVDVPFHLRED